MAKTWKEPTKGTFGKVKGCDRRREESRKSDQKVRFEIQQIMRRTGERLETFLD